MVPLHTRVMQSPSPYQEFAVVQRQYMGPVIGRAPDRNWNGEPSCRGAELSRRDAGQPNNCTHYAVLYKQRRPTNPQTLT
eukprot:CAMPEP_0174356944 /NCGR_PEP_ID=MMETSP0811_2-20130205/32955_1 /TAXON_ID=73025 ORGANISM="Eutreptiella gymnastica-like, Strain CCMP1594" /NCGR_SAMPLE_ID=MMETSP0811_2 /ASSEMBLY_ACC=CAM_ASM_000667 /LENGTH=79 /DNA_ID=CAMNT_0015489303 /DNA_START=203 /DNA_END=442 /DNA_ORIENTATION=+